jgi:hypothetical protein
VNGGGSPRSLERTSVRSNDVQNDHATSGVILVLGRSLPDRTPGRGIPFNRQFQTWAALLTLEALPLFTLAYLLDDERR